VITTEKRDAETKGWRPCPRCARPLVTDGGTRARAERDIAICHLCCEAESLYGYDPRDQAPVDSWPLPPEKLGQEHLTLACRGQL
jgi:hypothetical protein